jgi:DNA polymerase III delta prime subunit
LSFHTITIPAQNALLKIIEEPRIGVRFILVTTNTETILPTLYSRLQEQTMSSKPDYENIEAKLFLQTPYEKRMKLPYIIELLGREDEEKRKDREAVRIFIISLAAALTVYMPNIQDYPKHTLTILESASYAGDPSSSSKSLLEYLSLVLPQTK